MTKKFVTITFSDKLNVTKPCSSRNSLGDEMKGLGDESHSSPKTIFLVVDGGAALSGAENGSKGLGKVLGFFFSLQGSWMGPKIALLTCYFNS